MSSAGQEFLSLHQTPLRVEMLISQFSIPIFTDGNKSVISHFIGVNAEILKVLSNLMNFSVVYQDPDPNPDDFDISNGTYTTGALGRLLNNESDLGLTLFFIRDYEINNGIDFTTPITENKLCIVVQKANRITETVLPLIIFDLTTWICLLICLIGCSMFWIFLRFMNIYRDNMNIYDHLYMMKSYPDYLRIIVDTSILLMSSPMLRLPKIWSERIFVISICLMSIIVIAYFQSILATVFVNPLYFDDIESLAALEESQLPIKIDLGLSVDNHLFHENSSLVQRIEIVEKDESLLSYIAQYGNLSTVLRKMSIQLDYSHWFLRKKLYQLPECPRTYMTAFVLPKNSIYKNRINQILLRLLRGGFIQKWIDDMMFNKTLENTRMYGSFEMRSYVVLNVKDMQFSFVVLLSGFTVSFVVFIGELLTHMAKKIK